jgi:hypothetical protein
MADETPMTKEEFSRGMNQVGAWMNGMERKLLDAIKKLQDDMASLQAQIAHLDK